MEATALVKMACASALDKKALRVIVQDLTGLSDMCSQQMICSGQSERQVKAIAQGIADSIKKDGKEIPLAMEGMDSGQWVVIDYGHTLIHVFKDDIRMYYGLESLWPSATTTVVSPSGTTKMAHTDPAVTSSWDTEGSSTGPDSEGV